MTDRTVPPCGAPLTQVLYLSEALARPCDVTALVEAARRKNAALSLNGALCYSGGHFAQWLEGPAAALDATLATIAADPRHRGLRVLLRREVERRDFEGWHMALLGFDGGDDLMRSLLAEPALDEARVLRLLKHIQRLVRGSAEVEPAARGG